MVAVLDLKKAEKLLEKYPPIVEIRVPGKLYTNDFCSKLKELDNLNNSKFKFLFVGIPLPDKYFNDQVKLKNFREEWHEILKKDQLIAEDQGIKHFELDFVKIHSVFDIGIEEYEKRFNTLINQKIKENL